MLIKSRIDDVGYKSTEVGEIPVNWSVKKLGEIGMFKKGKGIAKKDLSPHGSKCILYGELYTKYNETITEVESSTQIDKSKSIIGQHNDVLIPSSGETAIDIACASALLTDNVLIGGDVNIFTPYPEVSGPFISYVLNSVRKNALAKLAQGSSVYHLYADPLSKFLVMLPPIEEQKKIVDILSAVDKQIDNVSSLIDKSHELKTGLMQQLLTKGIGHTEFKETALGKIPADWEVSTLEQVSYFITKGATPTTYGFEWEESGILFFKSDVVKEGRFVYGNYKYISEEAHNQMSRSKIYPEDILITITGNIGRVAIVPKEIKEGNINQHIARVRVFNDSVNSIFVYHWLNQVKIVDYYNSIKTGLAYPQISLKQVRETLVPIPRLEEQQKIADILSAVDEQIQSHEQEQAKYLQLKKGLMQQLLTGQLRVTV